MRATAVFTVYTVIYLLTEFALYGRFLEIFGSGSVPALYATLMFLNGCGYLLFPCVSRFFAEERKKRWFLAAAAAVLAASAILTDVSSQHAVVILGAFASMIAGGYLGGAALYAGAVRLRGSGVEGRAFSAAIALSVLIQFPIQNYGGGPYIRLAAIAAGSLIFLKMILPLPEARSLPAEAAENTKRKYTGELVAAAVIVLLLSHFYGIGDGFLMKLNAEGKVSVVTWPRLLYVPGLLIAGFLADRKNGRYLTAVTLAVASVFSVYPLFPEKGLSYEIFHVTFWLFNGFYVVYLSVPFLKLSVNSGFPELWAGMGRSVKQFVNCISVIPTAILLDSSGPRWALYCNAAVVVAMTAFSCLILLRKNAASDAGAPETTGPGVVEEHLGSFAERYSLTQRETMVLEKMIVEDETAKEIGRSLYISERSCQRHITAIYEKAGVKNRAALLMIFFKDNNETTKDIQKLTIQK